MSSSEAGFPLEIIISFHKIIEQYEAKYQKESNPIVKDYIKNILEYVSEIPELKEGISDLDKVGKHREAVEVLLNDLFPHVLSDNDIKAVSIPFHGKIFHLSEKFQKILEQAGEDFSLEIRNITEDSSYIFTCILILNIYYKFNIDFSHPLYYDIPDENGIIKNYKLDMNTKFIDIFPSENAKKIREEDVDELLQNIDNIELWKRFFPPKSYILKGVSIVNLIDVTVEDAISELKTALISRPISEENELEHFQEIFRSIYKISDLQVGFTSFSQEHGLFEKLNKSTTSFILNDKYKEDTSVAICEVSHKAIIEEKLIFSISNVEKYSKTSSNKTLAKNLSENGIESCLLAPIAHKNNLLGVLELVSKRKNVLNSVNAIKLENVVPYIVTAIQRNKTEFENRIKAVIQNQCTSIHPSVLWVFEKEAKKFIQNLEQDGLASFRDIAFDDIYPLFGQIDIIASSEARNEAVQKDMEHQLNLLQEIFEETYKLDKLPIYEQVIFRIKEFKNELGENLSASSEQEVYNFFNQEVHPLLKHINKEYSSLEILLKNYYSTLQGDAVIIYNHRKNYDESVQKINRVLTRFLDSKQVEAQNMYPHFFERYKTDGVEHNIYIGAALTKKPYNEVYLYNLRIWQLKTMVEMENKFYQLQEDMPLMLSAASLILVYNNTLSIRYRMDEKQFDVDGTYNARYEIIKKRIDKACIKGKDERITQKGKIAIVYSQDQDEQEYMRYIKYLQAKEYLGTDVEVLELQDVQGVVGLKALRVNILYSPDDNPNKIVSLEEFLEDLA